MAKFDIALFPQSRQPTLSCIKEPVLFQIIFRIDPLFLEFSPYRFRNIQMRRVWWQESDEQSTLLPKRYPFHNTVGFMHTGIIQYQYGFLFNAEREFLQIFNERIGSDIRFCHHSHILALSVDKTKYIDFVRLLNRYVNILCRKLPTIRHISLRTKMRFISIIEVYLPCLAQMFKL